jgi:hypothetical protein
MTERLTLQFRILGDIRRDPSRLNGRNQQGRDKRQALAVFNISLISRR